MDTGPLSTNNFGCHFEFDIFLNFILLWIVGLWKWTWFGSWVRIIWTVEGWLEGQEGTDERPLFMLFEKQEVLGTTNCLISLIRHGPHWKLRVQKFFYCCICIRYHSHVSTKLLPSNNRGICTEPLLSNYRGVYTHTQIAMWFISLFYFFFKMREVG
jgi:hypothetical protein